MSALDRLKCIQNNFRQQWHGISCELSGRPGKSNFSPLTQIKVLQTSSIASAQSQSLRLPRLKTNARSFSTRFSKSSRTSKTKSKASRTQTHPKRRRLTGHLYPASQVFSRRRPARQPAGSTTTKIRTPRSSSTSRTSQRSRSRPCRSLRASTKRTTSTSRTQSFFSR